MNNLKILIVDDSIVSLKVIVHHLQQWNPNIKIFQSNSGIKAIEIAQKTEPDLIITDWDMPELNGIELILKLKSIEDIRNIPIIVASGIMITAENLKIAFDAGAVDYLRKPVDPIELIARVHSSLLIAKYHKEMMAIKDQELLESSLYLAKSNKFSVETLKKMHLLKAIFPSDIKQSENLLKSIISDLNGRIQEDSWHRFNLTFHNLHKNFNSNLVAHFPELTGMDLKLCAFVRLGMNNKDIAILLNQHPDSIKVSRYRLRKKLKLERSQNLENFLNGF